MDHGDMDHGGMDHGDMDNGGMNSGNSGHMHHDHNAAVHFGWTVPPTLVFHLVLIGLALGYVIPYAFACKQAKQQTRHMTAMVIGCAMAVLGALLGHIAGIEGYNPWLADLAVIYCLGCLAISLLLLVYVPRGVLSHMRRGLNVLHITLLVLQPLVCWVLVGLGFISLLGFCKADHMGQCLAHGIMGTAFIVYGILLLAMLYIGQEFLKRQNKSQEFYDSTVITLWGIINTFTEHRWGQAWNHGDIQHTSMGIVWWAVGLLGIYFSWNRITNKPRRHHIPAIIMIATGYSMATHVQNTQVSTDIHFMFGVFLMLAGLSRIIEISFVLHDAAHTGVAKAFQYLTPIFLVQSGCMFMSATEESMKFLADQSIMAAPYVLFVSSVAALIFLPALFCVESYVVMKPKDLKQEQPSEDIEMQPFLDDAREFDVE